MLSGLNAGATPLLTALCHGSADFVDIRHGCGGLLVPCIGFSFVFSCPTMHGFPSLMIYLAGRLKRFLPTMQQHSFAQSTAALAVWGVESPCVGLTLSKQS